MSWMHKTPFTPDPTPEDKIWREQVEQKFMIRADPAERERYPAGYWQQCYAHWDALDPQGHFDAPHTWWDYVKREGAYFLEYVWRRYFVAI